MTREEFKNIGLKKNSSILEFGPSYNPMYPKREGYNTQIVDHCSEDILRKEGYTAEQDHGVIEKVDYICSGHYYDYIHSHGGGVYDIIAASHVIEHVPDPISFLQDISKLLSESGSVKLVIPDKRYEFDTFREVTSIRSIVDNHFYRKKFNSHSVGAVIDSQLAMIHLEDKNVTIPNSFPLLDSTFNFEFEMDHELIGNIKKKIEEYDDALYHDAHSWVWTPKAFELLIYQLNVLGFIDLAIEHIYTDKTSALWRSCQFFVELKKIRCSFNPATMKNLFIERKKDELASYDYYIRMKQDLSVKDLYIYGAGKGAKDITKFLNGMKIDFKGYVVSDSHRENEFLDGHPVFELSEIDSLKEKDILFLIGIQNDHYRKDIIEELKKRNYKWLV